MSDRRLARVTELIHQEISKLVLTLKDPGLGFLTVVAVRMTHDFMQAKVFYSVLGTKDEKERTQLALDRAKPYFRHHLRMLESLKHPPELTFILDQSAEEAQKVIDVIKYLESERQQDPPQ